MTTHERKRRFRRQALLAFFGAVLVFCEAASRLHTKCKPLLLRTGQEDLRPVALERGGEVSTVLLRPRALELPEEIQNFSNVLSDIASEETPALCREIVLAFIDKDRDPDARREGRASK